jgi:hypothetical protein
LKAYKLDFTTPNHTPWLEADESLGRPFDPHYHEAVSVRHDPSQPDHIILETFQRGHKRSVIDRCF